MTAAIFSICLSINDLTELTFQNEYIIMKKLFYVYIKLYYIFYILIIFFAFIEFLHQYLHKTKIYNLNPIPQLLEEAELCNLYK